MEAVALIVALVLIGTGQTKQLLDSRATRRIVEGNGRGDVSTMSARALAELEELRTDVGDILLWQQAHAERHRKLNRRLAAK